MKWLGVSFIVLGVMLIAVLCATEESEAHHNGGILPGIPNTPFVQAAKARVELGFCFNPRASAYPNFREQMRQVHDAFAKGIGNTWREIGPTFTDPNVAKAAGCHEFHEMPDTHPCNGCAAHVFYANQVCHVQYKWQLGFTIWLSTGGHETGHCYGEHEGYDDIKFISHILTYGFWASPWQAPTVMDVGSHQVYPPNGIFGPTAADVALICTRVIQTSWCGQQPVDPPYHSCTQYPGWEGTWSCFWPGQGVAGEWLWLIPLHNRDSLWRWSESQPYWRCSDGCP